MVRLIGVVAFVTCAIPNGLSAQSAPTSTPPPEPPAPPAASATEPRVPSGLADAIRTLQRFISPPAPDSNGSAAPGASVEFDTQGVEFGPWIRRFIAQVKRNWFVPAAAMTAKGRSVVTFTVSKTGQIRDVKVKEASGVDQFDRSAFNAIMNANPVDPLPSAYPRDDVFFTVAFYFNEQPPKK